jgi:hypothetical protein
MVLFPRSGVVENEINSWSNKKKEKKEKQEEEVIQKDNTIYIGVCSFTIRFCWLLFSGFAFHYLSLRNLSRR